ncbi:MAG: SAM-dependent methyltransferase [Bacillota bacterium]
MKSFLVNPIGVIEHSEKGTFLIVEEKYRPALKELDGFSHINVLWWCDEFDTEEARKTLEAAAPYKKAPEIMGIFATRSPIRPNPVALTAVQVIYIDHASGRIQLAYIDANDGTPVVDIKPYTPSIDRVEEPEVPDWCSHWPKSTETSGNFNWAAEFNF